MKSILPAPRLAIVGCGWIAGVHAEAALKAHQALQIVACVDLNPETARSFASKHNIPKSYGSIAEMLADCSIDGAIICTWPTQHEENIYELLEGGVKTILCEKALTISAEAAAEVLRRTRAAGALVIEAFMFRYHPMYQLMREESLKIGPIDTIRAGFHEYDPELEDITDGARNWRQVKEAGGGVPFDYTCYSVHAVADLARSLPRSVSFYGENGRYGTLVRLHGHIVFENGTVALLHTSRRANVSKEVEICAVTPPLVRLATQSNAASKLHGRLQESSQFRCARSRRCAPWLRS